MGSIFVETFSSTILSLKFYITNLQHGIMVVGVVVVFVCTHNNHQHNADNPAKFEDFMEGRIRLLTAITPSYAHSLPQIPVNVGQCQVFEPPEQPNYHEVTI